MKIGKRICVLLMTAISMVLVSCGEKSREYTDEEKLAYTPTSLTMTLYDTENSVYGFTYNTEQKPLTRSRRKHLRSSDIFTALSTATRNISC